MVAKQPNESDNRNGKRPAEDATADRKNETTAKSARHADNTNGGDTETEQKSEPKSFVQSLEEHHALVTAASTVIVAIATVASACVAGALYMATMAANAVAEKAANTTQQSVNDAQTNARFELRPYLSVTGQVTGIDARGPINLRLTIKNTGRTPATNVVVKYRAAVGSKQIAGEQMKQMTCPCRDPSDTTFTRANVPTRLAADSIAIVVDQLPQSVRHDFISRKLPLRAFGCVTYSDVFNETVSESFSLMQGGPYPIRSESMGQDLLPAD